MKRVKIEEKTNKNWIFFCQMNFVFGKSRENETEL